MSLLCSYTFVSFGSSESAHSSDLTRESVELVESVSHWVCESAKSVSQCAPLGLVVVVVIVVTVVVIVAIVVNVVVVVVVVVIVAYILSEF